MSRLVTTDIPIGSELSVTNPNSTLANFRTVSDAIHRRNIALEAVVKQPAASGYEHSSSTSTVSSGSAAVLTHTGTAQVIGPFSYYSTTFDNWVIGASLEFWGQGASSNYGKFNFQLAYSTNWNGSSGTWNLITNTLRRAETPSPSKYTHGSISWMHLFTQLVGSTSSLYIAIMVWEPLSGVPRTVIVGHNSLFMLQLKR